MPDTTSSSDLTKTQCNVLANSLTSSSIPEQTASLLSCVCEICGEPFTNKRRRLRHVQVKHPASRHGTVPELPCPVEGCHRVFSSSVARSEHCYRAHPLYRRPQCDLCGGLEFRDQRGLTKHQLIHHIACSKDGAGLLCPIVECSKPCKDYTALRRHLRSYHNESSAMSHNCVAPGCPEPPFPTLQALIEHRNSTHGGFNFFCPYCPKKGYVSRRSFRNHLQECHQSQLTEDVKSHFKLTESSNNCQADPVKESSNLDDESSEDKLTSPPKVARSAGACSSRRSCGNGDNKPSLSFTRHHDLPSNEDLVGLALSLNTPRSISSSAFLCPIPGCQGSYSNESNMRSHFVRCHLKLKSWACLSCTTSASKNGTEPLQSPKNGTESLQSPKSGTEPLQSPKSGTDISSSDTQSGFPNETSLGTSQAVVKDRLSSATESDESVRNRKSNSNSPGTIYSSVSLTNNFATYKTCFRHICQIHPEVDYPNSQIKAHYFHAPLIANDNHIAIICSSFHSGRLGLRNLNDDFVGLRMDDPETIAAVKKELANGQCLRPGRPSKKTK